VRRLRGCLAAEGAGVDEVTGDRLDTLLLECEGAGFYLLIHHGYAGMLP
jgi:hypothetical protein